MDTLYIQYIRKLPPDEPLGFSAPLCVYDYKVLYWKIGLGQNRAFCGTFFTSRELYYSVQLC